MRIDCEVHIGKYKGDFYRWVEGDVSVSKMEDLMDEFHLDMCIVMAPTTNRPDNNAIAVALKGHPRLMSFAVVNPDGPGGGVPELERAVSEWGMKGLKLHPPRHGYEIDGDAPNGLACRSPFIPATSPAYHGKSGISPGSFRRSR